MKHVLLMLVLTLGAVECDAQFLNFGSRGFGGGRGIGRGPMVFRTPHATGRFRSNMWMDFTTRRGARVVAPYNWRSDRLDYGNMLLMPNYYWGGWQGGYWQRPVDEEEYNFDDGPAPRPATEQTGWRKYLRN
jgi:hypothetical protein